MKRLGNRGSGARAGRRGRGGPEPAASRAAQLRGGLARVRAHSLRHLPGARAPAAGRTAFGPSPQTRRPHPAPARPFLPASWRQTPLHTTHRPLRGACPPHTHTLPAAPANSSGFVYGARGGGRAGFWYLMIRRPNCPAPGRHVNTPAPYPTPHPLLACALCLPLRTALANTRPSFTRSPTPDAAVTDSNAFTLAHRHRDLTCQMHMC